MRQITIYLAKNFHEQRDAIQIRTSNEDVYTASIIRYRDELYTFAHKVHGEDAYVFLLAEQPILDLTSEEQL